MRLTKERSEFLKKVIEEAIAAGEKLYFDPVPCAAGHVGLHYVNGRSCRICNLAYTPKWRSENPEKARAAARRGWVNNREGRQKSFRKYQQANHHKTAFWARKRRAQIRQAGGSHTWAEVADIFKMQKNKCAYFWRCGVKFKKGEGEVDHIIPISRGGTDDRRNLQILCYKCNRDKWATDQIEFMQAQGALL